MDMLNKAAADQALTSHLPGKVRHCLICFSPTMKALPYSTLLKQPSNLYKHTSLDHSPFGPTLNACLTFSLSLSLACTHTHRANDERLNKYVREREKEGKEK